MMSNRLSRTIIRLLVANMSYRAATIIMKIFLNIFILQLTWDLKIVAIFSMYALGFHMFWYWGLSYVLKYGYRNLSYYIALLWTGLLLLSLVFRPEYIGEYYMIYGTIYGIFSGIYWCVYNNNQFDFTVPKNRWNYEWLKKSIRTWVSIGVPLFIWSLIAINPLGMWYQFSFLIASLLCFISWVFGRVDETKIQISKSKIQFFKYIKITQKYPDIWKIMWINFLISFALSMPLIEVLFPLILHSDGFNEAKIWFFISLASVLSIIVSYIFWKYVAYTHYKKAFALGAIIYIITIFWAIIWNSSVFIYGFIPLAIILYIIIDIPRSVFIMNILHDIEDYERYKWEHMLLQEIWIISGRSIVFILLFIVWVLTHETVFFTFTLMWWAMFLALILFMNTRHLDKD